MAILLVFTTFSRNVYQSIFETLSNPVAWTGLEGKRGDGATRKGRYVLYVLRCASACKWRTAPALLEISGLAKMDAKKLQSTSSTAEVVFFAQKRDLL